MNTFHLHVDDFSCSESRKLYKWWSAWVCLQSKEGFRPGLGRPHSYGATFPPPTLARAAGVSAGDALPEHAVRLAVEALAALTNRVGIFGSEPLLLSGGHMVTTGEAAILQPPATLISPPALGQLVCRSRRRRRSEVYDAIHCGWRSSNARYYTALGAKLSSTSFSVHLSVESKSASTP